MLKLALPGGPFWAPYVFWFTLMIWLLTLNVIHTYLLMIPHSLIYLLTTLLQLLKLIGIWKESIDEAAYGEYNLIPLKQSIKLGFQAIAGGVLTI